MDSSGEVLAAKVGKVGGCPILVAECLAVQEGLKETDCLVFKEIIIETDSQLVSDSVSNSMECQSTIINLIEDIRQFTMLSC